MCMTRAAPETHPGCESHVAHGLTPQRLYESHLDYGRESGLDTSAPAPQPETQNGDESQHHDGLTLQFDDESHNDYGREMGGLGAVFSDPVLRRLLHPRKYAKTPESFKPHLLLLETTVDTATSLTKMRVALSNQLAELIYHHGVEVSELEKTYLFDALKTIYSLEREVKSSLKHQVSDEDPVMKFLLSIPGVSYELTAQFLAEVVSLNRFKGLRSLYHYAGLHVVDGHAPTLRDMAEGRTRWNQRLRSLMYKMVMNVLKAHAKNPNIYGAFYYEARENYEKRGDAKSKKHIHLRAARLVAKKILKDIWAVAHGDRVAASSGPR
jgi:hypothetical protein